MAFLENKFVRKITNNIYLYLGFEMPRTLQNQSGLSGLPKREEQEEDQSQNP